MKTLTQWDRTRTVTGLQRALWWVLALVAAYAVASRPDSLFATGTP